MKGEFYKMDYEAWDEGTDELTLEQEAAYLRLCHQLYRRKAAIPSAPATLARIWRCHPNKARKLLADLIAAGKIVETHGHLTNTRVTRELDERETKRTHKVDAGHTGGTRTQENRRKLLKTNDADEADAQAENKQNQAEKEIEGEKKREESTPVVPKGTQTGFERFRAAYPPKHVSFPTQQARKRYDQAIKGGATHDEIEAGAKAYAAEQIRIGKSGTEFVKSADSWLYQRRWLDFAQQGSDPPGASTTKLNPAQDRRHRLRLAIDHFRDEWRQGTDEQYRPGTAGCTTLPQIVEEARASVAAERLLTSQPQPANAA
ncbi:DUF1376 domain-containing protein [Methylobacterium sp. Leaf117]|uniref:DUF1376 domain-containing protein n=1 Tax=Methylobacterium sp. Leaf117 TaxID=1736260 RepID=UPI0006F25100|nr:DUF1376 domain-containing protein [Methylobacterium sp. Leaf117]KQP82878.1 hypothetical protein ASF57_12140 [Methylobacterium sp. Leaf117]